MGMATTIRKTINKTLAALLILSFWWIYAPQINAANTNSADFESGSSQSLSTADEGDLDIVGDWTAEFWINLETAQDATERYVFSKYNGAGDQRAWYVGLDKSGANFRIKWIGSEDGVSGVQKAWYYELVVGTWYHVAITYDLDGGGAGVPQLIMYVNGASEGGPDADDDANEPDALKNSTDDLEIGALSASGFFDGKLDDLRFWAEERTAANISDNYQSELNGNDTNLKAYYMFNDSEGNLQDRGTVTDPAGSAANDLTNNNTVTFPTDVPFPIASAAILPGDPFFFAS